MYWRPFQAALTTEITLVWSAHACDVKTPTDNLAQLYEYISWTGKLESETTGWQNDSSRQEST